MTHVTVSKQSVDFVAHHLRAQVLILQSIIDMLERTNDYHEEFISYALRKVGIEIRCLRRHIMN